MTGLPDRDRRAARARAQALCQPTSTPEPLLRRSGPDGAASAFNAAWLAFTKRTLAAALGDGWLDDVHPEDQFRCCAIHAEMAPGRTPYELDYRLRHAERGYRWVMEQATPVLDAEGSFAGYTHHCMDVHERSELADELANRLTRMRVALRHHAQFEALLAAELEQLPTARIRFALQTMARLAAASGALVPTRLRLQDWVATVVGEARAATRERSLPFAIESPDEPLDLELEAPLLTRALSDVLAGAALAASPPAQIELRALRVGRRVHVELPAREHSSAFALLVCVVHAHGGEAGMLDGIGRARLTLPLADPA